jgi:hypothetical protein
VKMHRDSDVKQILLLKRVFQALERHEIHKKFLSGNLKELDHLWDRACKGIRSLRILTGSNYEFS